MKKRTIIFYSFLLTLLLMTGCGRTNKQPQPSATAAAETTTTETETPSAENASSTSQETDKAVSMITEAEAKEIALAHANLVTEEVTFSKCELDREREGTYYDINFHTEDRLEYDYDIDAYTGTIISYEWDEDDLFLE